MKLFRAIATALSSAMSDMHTQDDAKAVLRALKHSRPEDPLLAVQVQGPAAMRRFVSAGWTLVHTDASTWEGSNMDGLTRYTLTHTKADLCTPA